MYKRLLYLGFVILFLRGSVGLAGYSYTSKAQSLITQFQKTGELDQKKEKIAKLILLYQQEITDLEKKADKKTLSHKEIEHRKTLFKLLGSVEGLYPQHYANALELSHLYNSLQQYHQAIEILDRLLNATPPHHKSEKYIVLQYLSKLNAKLQNYQSAEHYFSKYALAVKNSIDYNQAAENYKILILYGEKSGNKNVSVYYSSWFKLAESFDSVEEKLKVLRKWVHYAIKAEESGAKEVVTQLASSYIELQKWHELSQLYLQYASSIDKVEAANAVYWEYFKAMKQNQQVPNLEILSRLYNYYKAKGHLQEEQEVLTSIYYHQDHSDKQKALSRLANLAIMNEDWSNAYVFHETLLTSEYAMKSVEGPAILESLIRISQRLSDEERYIYWLKEKVFSASPYIVQNDRYAAFQELEEFYLKHHRYQEGLMLFDRFLESGNGSKRVQYQVYLWGGELEEKLGHYKNAYLHYKKAYQLAPKSLSQNDNRNVTIAKKMLLLAKTQLEIQDQLVAYELLKEYYLEIKQRQVVDILWNIGRLHESSQNREKAIWSYKEALEQSRKFSDHDMETQLLGRLNHLETGDAQGKLRRLTELAASQERSSKHENLIFTRIEIGNIYLLLNRSEEAFQSYLQAAKLRATKDPKTQIKQLIMAAENLLNIDQNESSLVIAEAILPLTKIDDRENQAKIWSLKARNQYALDRLTQATESIDTALAFDYETVQTNSQLLKSDILLKQRKFTEASVLLEGLDQKDSRVMLNSAKVSFALGEYQTAIDLFKKIILLDEAQKKAVDLAFVYSMYGQACFHLQDINGAIREQHQLVSFLKQKEDMERLGTAYLNLSRYQLAAGKINQAKESNYQAGLIIDQSSNKYNRLLFYRAQIAQRVGKTEEAIENYDQIINSEETEKDNQFLGSVYYGRGTTLYKKLFLEKAEKDLETAIRFFEDANSPNSVLQARLALASVCLRSADYVKADRILNDLKKDAQNSTQLGPVLMGLASLKADLTEYKEALKYTDQAITIFAEEQKDAQLMEAYNIKASIFLRMDDFTSAEINYAKANEINQKVNNDLFRATVVSNLGALYQKTGKYDQALKSYLRSAQIQSDLGFEAELALTMNNIAACYMSLKDYKHSIDYLQKSQRIGIKYGLKREVALALSNEGIANFQLGKLLEAKTAFIKSSEMQERLGLKIDQAKTLNNIAFIEKEQKDLNAAIRTVQKALGLLSSSLPEDFVGFPNPDLNSITSPNLVKDLLLNKGFWLRDLSENSSDKVQYLKAAADSLSKSIDLLEIIRNQLKVGQSQELLVAQNIDVFENLITIYYELGQLESQENYYAKAFPIAEQSKARSFLDKFQEQIASANISLPKAFREKENVLKSRLVTINANLFNEINKTDTEKDPQKIKALNLQKNELQLAFNNLKEELENRFPNYANIKYPKIYGFREIREEIITPGNAVVSYFCGNEASYGWYISGDQLQMIQLPGKKELKKLIEKYRLTLKNPLFFYDEEEDAEVDNYRLHLALGLKLYNILFKPFSIEPDTKSILLLADGAIHYLPFETLITKIDLDRSEEMLAAQNYLIEDFSVYYAPSASVLGAAMENLKLKRSDQGVRKEFLGFGDPEFSLVDTDDVGEINPVFKEKGFYDLSRLNASAVEVSQISAMFGKNQITFFQQNALEEKAKALSDSYKYIHFATHGILDEENPEYSGVVLNLVRKQKEDGFLQSSEIWDMQLNADLVTLSACETGLGKIVSGEGMVGLTRSFLYAGSASVVVSLWTVADDSTSELMINFYKYLKEGYPKIEALRRAKLEFVLQNAKYSSFKDPFFWGPFVLNGLQR